MPKTIHYKATFSDGKVFERGSKTRAYSHAWRATADHVAGGERCSIGGFSRSEALAVREGERHARGFFNNPKIYVASSVAWEIAPAVQQ